MPLLLSPAMAISFHTNFGGGNLGPVETVAPGHYRCPVSGEADSQQRNRQASSAPTATAGIVKDWPFTLTPMDPAIWFRRTNYPATSSIRSPTGKAAIESYSSSVATPVPPAALK